MEKYQATFEDNGYDDLCYMGGGLVTKEDLLEIGINDPQDCTVLIDSLKLREHKFLFDKEGKPNLKDLASGTMEEWLKSIGLSQYEVKQAEGKTLLKPESVTVIHVPKEPPGPDA